MASPKTTKKSVRRSITLPAEINRKVQELARRERRKTNQVMEELIASGLESKENEKRRFFELAERLRTANTIKEQQRIKEELARMTFGA
jgi:predicted transcriptional regulator